jgi:hypothetical protein
VRAASQALASLAAYLGPCMTNMGPTRTYMQCLCVFLMLLALLGPRHVSCATNYKGRRQAHLISGASGRQGGAVGVDCLPALSLLSVSWRSHAVPCVLRNRRWARCPSCSRAPGHGPSVDRCACMAHGCTVRNRTRARRTACRFTCSSSQGFLSQIHCLHA